MIATPDVQRLREFRQTLDQSFANDLAAGRPVSASGAQAGAPASAAVDLRPEWSWATTEGDTTGWLEVDLGAPTLFNVSMTQEQIAQGQRVEGYRIEAWDDGWKSVAQGTTVGHKKLDRFPELRASRVRLTIDKALAAPRLRRFGLFHVPSD